MLKDYRVLFNSYLDSDTYDMLFLLNFDNYSSVAQWREIEKTSPGGLSAAGLKLDFLGRYLLARRGSPRHLIRGAGAREECVLHHSLRL